MEPGVRFELTTCCLQGRPGPCRPVSLRAPKSAEQRFRAYYVYGVSLTGLVETQRIDTSVIHRRSSMRSADLLTNVNGFVRFSAA